jgi:hypothetical protein
MVMIVLLVLTSGYCTATVLCQEALMLHYIAKDETNLAAMLFLLPLPFTPPREFQEISIGGK